MTIFVKTVICNDLVIFKLPSYKMQLLEGVEQLDADIHLDVGLWVGVHGVYQLVEAVPGEPAVEGEENSIIGQPMEICQLLQIYPDAVLLKYHRENDVK